MVSSSISSSKERPPGLRRFIVEITLFALLQVAFYALLKGVIDRDAPITYFGGAIEKHRRLEEVKSPRLLFVGGSNLAFGLDSRRVQDAFPTYGVVNLGLNAGLPLTFILEEAEQGVDSGDVVVLVLEYEYFYTAHDQGSSEVLLQLLEHRPSSIAYVTTWQQIKSVMDKEALRYLGAKVRSIVSGRRDDPSTAVVYSRDAFNAFGDATAHYGHPSKLDLGPLIKRKQPDYQLDTDVAASLREFSERCRRKGVGVVFAHPPLPGPLFESKHDLFGRLGEELRAADIFPIINSPQEMSFPVEDFFDSIYHLSEAGGRKRTSMLIDRLAPVLSRIHPPKGAPVSAKPPSSSITK